MTKTYNPGRRLPNVPDSIPGIVKHEVVNNVVKIGVQCYDCHLVEEPVSQLLTTILHHPAVDDGHRRCKPCRVTNRAKNYPDCVCHMCREDAA